MVKRRMRRKAPRAKRRRIYRRSLKRRYRRRMNRNLSLKRTVYNGSWTWGTAATSDFWRYYAFNATNFNNFGEFSGVFDEYRINAIKVTFRPRYDNVPSGSIAANLHYFVDPASTIVPSGAFGVSAVNTFLENEGVRTKPLNRAVSVYFKPKVSDQVFGGGTSSRLVRPGWIKTSETGVDHRGFHVFVQPNAMATTGTNIVLDIFFTFYIQFRNLK